MTNKNYRRGYVIERKVVNEFRDKGLFATRSAGSHSLFDVIALDKVYIYLIQLKRVKNKGYSFSKDVKTITNFTEHPNNVKKELWIYRDYEKRDNKWEKIKC